MPDINFSTPKDLTKLHASFSTSNGNISSSFSLSTGTGSGSDTRSIKELRDLIAQEVLDRQEADIQIVQEIDSRIGVADIVGTKAELDNYDKSLLTNNDIIKVLIDSSKGNVASYYIYSSLLNDFIYKTSEPEYCTSDEVMGAMSLKGDGLILEDGLLYLTSGVEKISEGLPVSFSGGGGDVPSITFTLESLTDETIYCSTQDDVVISYKYDSSYNLRGIVEYSVNNSLLCPKVLKPIGTYGII